LSIKITSFEGLWIAQRLRTNDNAVDKFQHSDKTIMLKVFAFKDKQKSIAKVLNHE